MNITDLVSTGTQLKAEIRQRQDQLKEIEAALIDRGAGRYEGLDGAECTVIVPNPGIKPGEADLEAARKIAGADFDTLFEKVTSFKPVKAFREVAAAVLTKAKAAKLFAVCEKTSSAFVKWAK